MKYYSGPLEAARSIVKKSGVAGMYRGALTQLVRDTPASVVYMLTYVFFQHESQNRLQWCPSQVIHLSFTH